MNAEKLQDGSWIGLDGEGLEEEIDFLSKADEARDASVLLLGETGVGKSMAAKQIHGRGERQDKPFIAENVGSLHPNILESELFGHEPGAFTGATKKRQGLFVTANEGTLFLDEIGELPHDLQSKLLRAVQSGEIRPLGSDQSLKTDARIITATHKDLSVEIQQNRFREDLYYRLAQFKLEIPPLRERPNALMKFISHYLGKYGAHDFEMEAPAVEFMLSQKWKGNIRQLESVMLNLCARVKYQGRTTVTLDDIKKYADLSAGSVEKEGSVNDYRSLEIVTFVTESRTVIDRVIQCAGNRTLAAKSLGVSRRTLYTKLEAIAAALRDAASPRYEALQTEGILGKIVMDPDIIKLED